MSFILSLLALLGFSFSLWVFMGLLRFVSEKLSRVFAKQKVIYQRNKYSIKDVAVVIPAHNEESVITRTLQALVPIIPRDQIYIVSDCSTDNTVKICRSFKVHVTETVTNLGKAKGLVYCMKRFNLLNKYKLLLINDADTEIDKNYFKNALPFFNDPKTAAVAGHGISRIERYSFWQAFIVAYRLRLWRLMQFCIRYGQTWKYMNASFIIPGAFSIYRTEVLKQLEIDAPGLMIEDFNMTFEVHKKKLGRIAYSPNIFGTHQDPYNLRDYTRQLHRWDVGYFQTVKRHGIWPSKFWFFTTVYNIELYFAALTIAIAPSVFIMFILNGFSSVQIPFIYENLIFVDFLVGLLLMDYMVTLVISYFERKPMLLVFGLGFIMIRYIDALIYIGAPIVAQFKKSSGTWKSPKRL